MSFYEKYVQLCGNLKDKPDRATPYKIDYLKSIVTPHKNCFFIFPNLLIRPPEYILNGPHFRFSLTEAAFRQSKM